MKNMYKSLRLVVAFSFLVSILFANAQRTEITYPDSWHSTGFKLERQSQSSVQVAYSIAEFAINQEEINGEVQHLLEIAGNFLPSDEGTPNLPGNGRYIAIPQGSSAVIRIVDSRTELISNINLAPAPNIPLGDDDEPLRFVRNAGIYEKNAFYPEQNIIVSQPSKIRGVDVVMLGITPFQYNPITQELLVYRDVRVEVTFEGGNGQFGEERYRNRWWDNIIFDAVLNHETLPEVDYSQRAINAALGDETGAEYLIIVPNAPEFAQWADTIRRFRQKQGISTKVVNLNQVGGNTSAAIQNYVHNAYNTWSIPPAAVLLMADHGTNATNSITSTILSNHPGGGSYNPYISDMPYADVSGNELPDITFARITARNAAELQLMVNKFLNHERNPPTNPHYYNVPITAMGWQTERWFQICAEVIKGFWTNVQGRTPIGINALYSGSPGSVWSTNSNTSMVVNYFGPNGLGYIPATPAHLTNWSGNATQVNNAINAGAFMLLHRDHGMETGWGEPAYTNSNIGGTNNTDLTYIWSVNCLTGRFDWTGECFAERFHRHTHGALGIMAATQVSYSFVNDTYVWGAFDNMWPAFMPDYGTNPPSRDVLPAFANDAGKYFLQQSNWPSNPQHKSITYKLFHQHGDAFMTVYSFMPQHLTVNHAPGTLSGLDFFEVTANPGSMIALTVNSEIIGVGTGTGMPVSIPIVPQTPGTEILLTITKQDFYRYEALLSVIPPDQPYMVYQSHVIEDDLFGNNNGQPDFGEKLHLGVEVKNLGLESDNNVMLILTSVSPYVEILQANHQIDSIDPETSVFISNAFKIEISDEVPNNTKIDFVLVMEGTNDTWTSNFSITACAPSFAAGNFIISDHLGNNNGSLDPGETGYLFIETNNHGNSDALAVNTSITINSNFVTVNETDYLITCIHADEKRYAVFSVTVSENAPTDTTIPFTFTADLGVYSAARNYNLKLGAMIEDFESGDFNNFNWQFAGNQNWTITEGEAWEGTYSARSGNISHSQSTEMKLTQNVATPSSVSFYRKVSSESGYDKLMFYIDGVKAGEWSGNRDWARVSYLVSPGERTFRWIYEKDASASVGSDCAWIDYIELPPQTAAVAWAGDDGIICGEETFTPNGFANNYQNLMWHTSGTGTFNNPTLQHPVYTPSQKDIENGSVMLTFSAHASNIMHDDLMLTFMPATIASAGSDFLVCEDIAAFELFDASAENYFEIEWSSSGTGYFNNSNSLHPLYYPSALDIAGGAVTLMITASNNNGCADASDQMILEFVPLATANAGNDIQICADDVAQLQGSASGYYQISWSTTGTGTFNDPSAQAPVYTPSADDISSGSVMLILTAHGIAGCPDASSAIELSFFDMPTAVISGQHTICEGEEVNLEIALTGTAPWQVVTSINNDVHTVHESPFVLSVSPEAATTYSIISVTDANLCDGAGSGSASVMVNYLPLTPAQPAGPDSIDYVYAQQSVFATQAVAGAIAYTWVIEPEEAGTMIANGIEATVNWSADFQGDINISVAAVNDCGAGELSAVKSVKLKNTTGVSSLLKAMTLNVYPNPSDGKFTLEIASEKTISFDVSVINTHGKVVYYKSDLRVQGLLAEKLDVSYLDAGVYFLQLTAKTGETISRRVVIR